MTNPLIPYAHHTCGSSPAWGALIRDYGAEWVALACLAVYRRNRKPVHIDAARLELDAMRRNNTPEGNT